MKDYKKILEGVVNIINTAEKSDIGFTNICTYIGENCPELAESEDEKIRKELIEYIKGQKITPNHPIADKWITWLEKQGEQKPAWSREDEIMIANIRDDLFCYQTEVRDEDHQLAEDIEKEINWLKSLKDRVYPKQEWKQENTDDLTDFENAMMHIGESFFGNNAGLDPNDIDAIKEQANTLLGLVPSKEWSEEDEQYLLVCKNALAKYQTTDKWDADIISCWLENKLKVPQNRWKPSDEQMRALEYIIDNAHNTSYSCKIAKELLEQLKKLKGH